MDKMAAILAESGAAFPQLAADQCRAWIQRILKEYEEAHEYLDQFGIAHRFEQPALFSDNARFATSLTMRIRQTIVFEFAPDQFHPFIIVSVSFVSLTVFLTLFAILQALGLIF